MLVVPLAHGSGETDQSGGIATFFRFTRKVELTRSMVGRDQICKGGLPTGPTARLGPVLAGASQAAQQRALGLPRWVAHRAGERLPGVWASAETPSLRRSRGAARGGAPPPQSVSKGRKSTRSLSSFYQRRSSPALYA